MAKVLVPFATGMEEIEAVVIVDVLRRAGVQVITAGLSDGPVQASRGTRHLPDTVLSEIAHEDFDMVILPGGNLGTQNLGKDSNLIELLNRYKKQGKWIAAICAAPSILKEHGILNSGQKFTGFPGSVEKTSEYTGSRLEESGKIITSIGPGSAFEFALRIVEILAGSAKKKEVEAGLYLHR
ncbi:DJ-1 family protein [Leptospira fainei serovar Hurstbridge str. BUT 6]|uniref:DJ-1 family protein n=1 Tax=Leptospira fainei serovar Hurstbridge str. BUT 6 TaxID=1193011 RepID=S3V606_9LEPT|nr:DJ-1 family glyoxalase III [Leptospira fainei]EPG76074.1 DJ-1 family protein [Leptospira fainei serovar Hurstbridge str. BUT 6]